MRTAWTTVIALLALAGPAAAAPSGGSLERVASKTAAATPSPLAADPNALDLLLLYCIANQAEPLTVESAAYADGYRYAVLTIPPPAQVIRRVAMQRAGADGQTRAIMTSVIESPGREGVYPARIVSCTVMAPTKDYDTSAGVQRWLGVAPAPSSGGTQTWAYRRGWESTGSLEGADPATVIAAANAGEYNTLVLSEADGMTTIGWTTFQPVRPADAPPLAVPPSQ